MSILIKGMDMPKGNGVKCICIFPDGKVSNIYDSERKQIATAFQLPPHGRLIDADALHEKLNNDFEDAFRRKAISSWEGWLDVMGALSKAQTIIEAEEVKE